MHFFRSLNVGKRLSLGFGLLLILMMVIVAFVIHNDKSKYERFDEVVNTRMDAAMKLERLLNIGGKIDALRRLMVIRRGEHFAEDAAQVLALNIEYGKYWEEVIATFTLPDTRELAAAMERATDAIPAHSQEFNRLIEIGQYDAARQYLLNELQDVTIAWEKATMDLITHQQTLARQKAKEYQALDHDDLIEVMTLAALCLLSGSLLAWLLTRSLVRPLSQAVRVADAIAEGEFDEKIEITQQDELGKLLDSMGNMRERVRAVIDAQREMARRHDEGQVSFRMDEARFPGGYGKMVQASNGLVQSHIDSLMYMIEVMGEYAVGNLSRDIDDYPGEKAILTNTMREVKHNLAAINTEIKRLSSAAANGDFSQRGDAEKFQYDFRAMVGGLNSMMASTDENLAQISSLLQAIAEGDLTQRMQGAFKGVFAKMRDDANQSAAQLAKIILEIQSASSAINIAAGEIAAGNHDLSRRTEQQAANLEETAASMEELTTTVRNNAEHAREANQLTLGAANVAEQGGSVVGQVVTTMSEIETSSKKIADIITVIDGIAFQTNILALNAAVEAARAGEQGRGFAVVATEVRSLAQRSATAAREIKTLIEDSTSKVSDGAHLAEEAGRTMGEIVASVKQVTHIMTEISSASQEQASGIEQVNQTIMQMDETTQKNAALVEEAAASAGSMEQQASALAQAVSMFKIDAHK